MWIFTDLTKDDSAEEESQVQESQVQDGEDEDKEFTLEEVREMFETDDEKSPSKAKQTKLKEPKVKPEKSKVKEPKVKPEQSQVKEPKVKPEQSKVKDPKVKPEQSKVKDPKVKPDQLSKVKDPKVKDPKVKLDSELSIDCWNCGKPLPKVEDRYPAENRTAGNMMFECLPCYKKTVEFKKFDAEAQRLRREEMERLKQFKPKDKKAEEKEG